MKIAIGNDHAAVELKNAISDYLKEKGIEVLNMGCDTSESYNYPVAGEEVARAVVSGMADQGIVICGTGIGISLAANKVNGIRCAVVSEPVSARLSKEHNNCNMIAFGARIVGVELAKSIVDAWLEAEFLGGRHAQRVDMIMDIEKRNSSPNSY